MEINSDSHHQIPRIAASSFADRDSNRTTSSFYSFTSGANSIGINGVGGSRLMSKSTRTMTAREPREDLEYHITFPAPIKVGPSPSPSDDSGIADQGLHRSISKRSRTRQKETPSSDVDQSTDTDESSTDDLESSEPSPQSSTNVNKLEPVVVLLGWYACEDRHLSKYSKLYEDMGCITMRFIPRPDLFLYQPDNMRAIASKLVELVVDFNLVDHPIIIHMFSNGGCYVYRHICELLNGECIEDVTASPTELPPSPKTPKLQVRGVVFDSGPAINSPLNFFRAIRDTTRGNTIYRWMRGAFLMLVVVIAFIVEYLMGFVWSDVRNRSAPLAMWACLTKDPLRCPQLFLYSKADIICDHKSIKSFIDERRKCGVPVYEVCWDDSPHVKHLLLHREEYVKQVVHFVGTCLTDDTSTSVSMIYNHTVNDLSNPNQQRRDIVIPIDSVVI